MNNFAVLNSSKNQINEIVYFPIIYEGDQNTYTYLNFQLNDSEDKFINIVKHQLRIDVSEINKLREDFLNFQNNSNKISFDIKHTFTINNIIFKIAVNLIDLKVLVCALPCSFNKRAKSKNKFKRRWVRRDLDLISDISFQKSEIDLSLLYLIKRKIFNQAYVDNWNNTITSLIKTPIKINYNP